METSLPMSEDSKKLAVTNGFIWSAINIAIFLVIFYVKPDLLGSFSFAGITLVISNGLAIYFCLDMRKRIGGYWSFKEALISIFIMFFTQAVIVLFFTIIFGKFIEPSYPTKMKEIASASALQIMEKMGMDQETIDKAMADSDERFEKQFNPGLMSILMTLGSTALMYFIGALIFAAIFKKERPVFSQITEEV